MNREAPLRVTVEIRLLEGPASGQRRFRLSRTLRLPPAVRFDGALPVEGTARAEVWFPLPDGPVISARALLHHDPEYPERGSEAELVDVASELQLALEAYVYRPDHPPADEVSP